MNQILKYHIWADNEIMKLAYNLDIEEWNRELNHENVSIRIKCVHLVGAIDIWLERIAGKNPDGREIFELYEKQDREDLFIKWRQINDKLKTIIERDVSGSTTYSISSGEQYTSDFKDIFDHLFLHATYHRGQMVIILRMMGKEPVNTDYINYLRHKK